MRDSALLQARQLCEAAHRLPHEAQVNAFFHAASGSLSYVVSDPGTRACAIIDGVLDFEPAAARTSTNSADRLIDFIRQNELRVEWLLETHIHADRLSASGYLQAELGSGAIAIGSEAVRVREQLCELFHSDATSLQDFDRYFRDGELLGIGTLPACVLHVPGHTPADVAYVIGDCVFVGDTLFMPDSGTARADFPGGDARQLYRSIRRILSLPERAQIHVCHDYPTATRSAGSYKASVAQQRSHNIHINDGIAEDDFVRMRTERDATLSLPNLFAAAVQINLAGGRLPSPAANGLSYLSIPLNEL